MSGESFDGRGREGRKGVKLGNLGRIRVVRVFGFWSIVVEKVVELLISYFFIGFFGEDTSFERFFSVYGFVLRDGEIVIWGVELVG